MRKFAKFIALALTLCISLCSTGVYAMADHEAENVSDAATPYNIAITSTSYDFTISSTGLASCYGKVSVRSGYTVRLVMQLQQKGSMWKTVQSWNNTSSSGVICDETHQLEKGYDYRLMLIYIAYDEQGNQVESLYDTSSIISYK